MASLWLTSCYLGLPVSPLMTYSSLSPMFNKDVSRTVHVSDEHANRMFYMTQLLLQLWPYIIFKRWYKWEYIGHTVSNVWQSAAYSALIIHLWIWLISLAFMQRFMQLCLLMFERSTLWQCLAPGWWPAPMPPLAALSLVGECCTACDDPNVMHHLFICKNWLCVWSQGPGQQMLSVSTLPGQEWELGCKEEISGHAHKLFVCL